MTARGKTLFWAAGDAVLGLASHGKELRGGGGCWAGSSQPHRELVKSDSKQQTANDVAKRELVCTVSCGVTSCGGPLCIKVRQAGCTGPCTPC